MGVDRDTAVFIRGEFECFVRIGLDAVVRDRVRTVVDHLVRTGRVADLCPTICFEVRDGDGTLREVWHMETTPDQVIRLHEFLGRFTAADVHLIRSMLGGPAGAA